MVLLTEIPKGGFSGEESELILKCLQDNQVKQTMEVLRDSRKFG